MYTDAHCHLNYTDYGDLDELIARAEAVGVDIIICAGTDAQSSDECRDIAERYPSVYFTAGLHPTELKRYRDGDLEKIEKLLVHPRCVAVGETGLDFHYDDTDRRMQAEMFVRQMALAEKYSLPVQIHSRDCAAETFSLVCENAVKLRSGALLHCYSYSEELALRFEKRGFRFSFGGTSTYGGSKKARRTIAALREESLLTETDSPYLPPASMRGTFPNTPLSVPEIARNMAEVRGVSVERLCAAVRGNTRALFKKII